MLTPREQQEADRLVLEGNAPDIQDEDPDSSAERAVNRLWGAIFRLGEAQAHDVEPLIRDYLGSDDPTIRGVSLVVLAGLWGRSDVLGRCPDIAVDDSEDVIVRAAAVEALVKSGGARDEHLRPLLEWLAISDAHPGLVRRAAVEGFRDKR